jgi:Raf kinase inhibitor-like YbhB/YbcL family protein
MNWNVTVTDWIDPIPSKYACSLKGYGQNISPSISWEPVPNAKSYAIILQDIHPISHSYIHWYIPSISPDIQEIESLSFQSHKNINMNHLFDFYQKHSQIKVRQGINTRGSMGYFGPCPPPGSGRHIYVFRIMALDQDLQTMQISDLYKPHTFDEWDSLLKEKEIHVLAQKNIKGYFQK